MMQPPLPGLRQASLWNIQDLMRMHVLYVVQGYERCSIMITDGWFGDKKIKDRLMEIVKRKRREATVARWITLSLKPGQPAIWSALTVPRSLLSSQLQWVSVDQSRRIDDDEWAACARRAVQKNVRWWMRMNENKEGRWCPLERPVHEMASSGKDKMINVETLLRENMSTVLIAAIICDAKKSGFDKPSFVLRGLFDYWHYPAQ